MLNACFIIIRSILWSFHFSCRFFNEIIFCQHSGRWASFFVRFVWFAFRRCKHMKWNYFDPFVGILFLSLFLVQLLKATVWCLLVKIQVLCVRWKYAPNTISSEKKNNQISWFLYSKYFAVGELVFFCWYHYSKSLLILCSSKNSCVRWLQQSVLKFQILEELTELPVVHRGHYIIIMMTHKLQTATKCISFKWKTLTIFLWNDKKWPNWAFDSMELGGIEWNVTFFRVFVILKTVPFRNFAAVFIIILRLLLPTESTRKHKSKRSCCEHTENQLTYFLVGHLLEMKLQSNYVIKNVIDSRRTHITFFQLNERISSSQTGSFEMIIYRGTQFLNNNEKKSVWVVNSRKWVFKPFEYQSHFTHIRSKCKANSNSSPFRVWLSHVPIISEMSIN